MNASDYCPVTSRIVEDLKTICGETYVYFDDRSILEKYSRDKVPGKYGHMPEVVVLPKPPKKLSTSLNSPIVK